YVEINALVPEDQSHSHVPSPYVLKLVGDAFKNAPPGQHVRVHFDMGSAYLPVDPVRNIDASEYVIGSNVARGGETIPETACNPAKGRCQFPSYPGTVSWKVGFQLLRDEPVVNRIGQPLTVAEKNACLA